MVVSVGPYPLNRRWVRDHCSARSALNGSPTDSTTIEGSVHGSIVERTVGVAIRCVISWWIANSVSSRPAKTKSGAMTKVPAVETASNSSRTAASKVGDASWSTRVPVSGSGVAR